METPQESGAGYPEEQPADVADSERGDPRRREGDRPHDEADDGTATGNPRDAGSTERGDPPG
jgi:hypothetical protein